MQEFSNFEEFVEGLDNDKTLQEYGMLKVFIRFIPHYLIKQDCSSSKMEG